MYLLILGSMTFQLAAAILALRLIPETGRRWSWILISLGLIGMVLRRGHVFLLMVQGLDTPDPFFELLGFTISVTVFIGIALIRPLFHQLKETNEKLAESELRFKTVADFTHDWEYWRSPDGNFIYMSPSCKQVTGYPRSRFMQQPDLIERIVHPDDKEKMTPHLVAELHKKQSCDMDFRIIAADGSVQWLSHRCLPVFDPYKKYLGVRASNRNITQRKLVEARLKENQRLYRELVEQARSIILELNPAGEVVFINEFAQNFFGYTLEELRGVQASGTLFPKDAAKNNPLSSKDTPLFDEGEAFRKNGCTAWISWARSVIRNQEGEPKGLLCVGIDITARKAAEKLKDDVERIVRHDLKSPLMGIIGLPRLLIRDENLTKEQKEMLKALQEAGEQMLHLINQSLNLYKLETDTYEYSPKTVDLLEIVRRAIRDLQNHFPNGPKVEITLNGLPASDTDQVLLPGDETLLYGMTANLLKNGLEAADAKPVAVRFQENHPCIMEIQNSLVVPSEIRQTFFEKYATFGKNDGTGLGTYSALLAVKAHGGNITMHCSEEEGTIVRVELPCFEK